MSASKEFIKEFGELSFKQIIQLKKRFCSKIDYSDHDFTGNLLNLKFTGNTKNLIERHIYFFDSYELGILNLLKNNLSPNSIFIDIGANIGIHSLYASQFCKEVYSIEPYPLAIKKFSKNIEINNIHNIKSLNFALDEQNKEETPFFIPPAHNIGAGYLNNSNGNSLYVQTRSALDFFKQLDLKNVDIIKLDIEGNELKVLNAILPYIKKYRFKIIFEYSKQTHAQSSQYGELINFIRNNYNMSIIMFPNIEDSPIKPWNFDYFGNIFLTPH